MAQDDRWNEEHAWARDRDEARRRRREGGYDGFGPRDRPGFGGPDRQRRGLTGRPDVGGETRGAGYASAGETAGYGGETYGGFVDRGHGGPPDDSGFHVERRGRSGYGIFGSGGDYSSGAGPAGDYRGRGPRGYRRSDERIQEDVCERLTEDPFVDASEIEVSVENGEVTLSGRVDSRRAKRLAEDLAEAVSAVAYVQNNLRVERPDPMAGRDAVSATGAAGGTDAVLGAAGGTGTTASADRTRTQQGTGIAGTQIGTAGLGRRRSGAGG